MSTRLKCSSCGSEHSSRYLKFKQCPFCGGKLESVCSHTLPDDRSAWRSLSRDEHGEEWKQCRLCGETNL